jgi:hypothetical protein
LRITEYLGCRYIRYSNTFNQPKKKELKVKFGAVIRVLGLRSRPAEEALRTLIPNFLDKPPNEVERIPGGETELHECFDRNVAPDPDLKPI